MKGGYRESAAQALQRLRRLAHRIVLACSAALLLLLAGCIAVHWHASRPWAQWQTFAGQFIQSDGRVADTEEGAATAAENQMHALFLALVANDRPSFERMLAWSRDNLSGGDLTDRLPAAHWLPPQAGADEDADSHASTSAGLWLAYVLMEASRLWDEPHWEQVARVVLWRVKTRAVTSLEEIGPVLLPAVRASGAPLEPGRFDPALIVPFQLRYFARHDPTGPWLATLRVHERLLVEAAPAGVATDGFEWADGVIQPDPQGSDRAMLVYLWAGLSATDAEDPMLVHLRPYAALIGEQGPPAKVNVGDATPLPGLAPPGHAAAMLPFLRSLGEDQRWRAQRRRLSQLHRDGLLQPLELQQQILLLLGGGQAEGRYRIDAEGRLQPRWTRRCWRWL